MDRRRFLKAAAMGTAGLGLEGCTTSARARRAMAKKPNLLVVFDDQHRSSAMGCMGNAIVKTPNFDRLASEGMVFENAFSCCPISAPFRGQLLTGNYPHKNGVVDNEYLLWDNQVTMAELLREAGYRTGFVGKFHLGYGPYTEVKRLGFDYMAANNCDHDFYKLKYYENEAGPFQVDTWAPIVETNKALAFVEDHLESAADKPFFLALSWGPPHWSHLHYKSYPEEFDIYDRAGIDVPPNVPAEKVALARDEIAHYYGNVTALDHQFGRILDFLEENGLKENTIVVFTSDHGDHLNSHDYGKPRSEELPPHKRASKATPYNESIHIPLIVADPRAGNDGARSDALISSVDLMPTLLSLCGVDIPSDVEGDDLSHCVLGKGGPEKDSVYLQILGPGWPDRREFVGYWRGVRTKRWVYARWHNHEHPTMLFDCENDPYEMTNLAGTPEYADVERQLENRLAQWIAETGDPFETGERDEIGMLKLGAIRSSDKFSRPPK